MKNPKIGKFDIFATYSYVKALEEGMNDDQAKIYGYMIAVCGAQAVRGNRSGFKAGGEGYNALKKAAEIKKKKTISPDDFDKIVGKMGDFWNSFLDRIYNLFNKGLSYTQVKDMADIPKKWGAKLDGFDFLENTK